MNSDSVLEDQRPWAFSRAQLTAGLRNHTGDNRLTIREIKEFDLPDRRPSVGRIRGIQVVCQGSTGKLRFELVLKEPQGTTRAGMAGAGRREVSFYRSLAEQIPIEIPTLLADQPNGEWLVFERIQTGTPSDKWNADQYLAAIDNLVSLHDRFWSLEEDLEIYNWLGRPLTRDFEVYIQAASTGLQRLLDRGTLPIFDQKPVYLSMLEDLVKQAGDIAQELKNIPSTLIHGDYWPGNLLMAPAEKLVTYDWQHVSIGPSILDLVKFCQASRWHFAPLPLSQAEITGRYRSQLANKNGFMWTDRDWDRNWDHALLWIFLTDWVDLLAQIPISILETRQADLESAWLKPVYEAINHQRRG
jgi:thiamine kinase-like enzyme